MNPRYLRLTLSIYRLRNGITLINNNNKESGIGKSSLNLEQFGRHTEKEQGKVNSEQKKKNPENQNRPCCHSLGGLFKTSRLL